MSAFDAVAPQFDHHRALPDSAARAVRAAVMGHLAPRPLLLDLGAGAGRIGWPFVQANDNYVGVDLSFGMVQAFRQRAPRAQLAQADGCALPFGDRAFDAVLLVQVFGGLDRWRSLIDEAVRVLRPGGALMLGRTRTPERGVDARMKRQFDLILTGNASPAETGNTRALAEHYLEQQAAAVDDIEAAAWTAARTPRGFLDRHAGGARFGRLPPAIQERSLRELAGWAVQHFGSLDASFPETHRFTLRTFTFER